MEPRNITGLETKGGPDGWVTAFTVKYSQDSKIWNPILDKKTKTEKIFLGNYDSDTPQTTNFELPINTRYVKVIPTKWNDNIQMRVEVHGCFEPYRKTISSKVTALLSSVFQQLRLRHPHCLHHHLAVTTVRTL